MLHVRLVLQAGDCAPHSGAALRGLAFAWTISEEEGMGRRRLAGFAVACALLAVPASAGATSPPAPPPTGTAADGPGALSHFDLARKDCVGTARNRRSKVWFT